MLSKRRLYFSEDQIYFECATSHQCETVHFVPAKEDLDQGVTGPWRDHRDIFAHVEYGDGNKWWRPSPTQLLQTYLKRDLTFDSDAIAGFMGILEVYRRAEQPWHHHFGLLYRKDANEGVDLNAAFVNALMWSGELRARRPQFPSWSWAGWKSQTFNAGGAYTRQRVAIKLSVETTSGELIDPNDVDGQTAMRATLVNWTPYIHLEAPMIDFKIMEHYQHKRDGFCVIIPRQSDGEKPVRLTRDAPQWNPAVSRSLFARTVALSLAGQGSCILVLGQIEGQDYMERLICMDLARDEMFDWYGSIAWKMGKVRIG